MKISIVTLSFNQHAYLKEAIDSVLSQGYSNLEYIVVDPGSTDGSRELIKGYGDRIAHTIFEPDRGASDGLNKGFAHATGDVFGFLNADDILFPGSLNHVARFFEAHPECDVVMGDGYKIDGRGRRTRHFVAHDFSVRRFFYGGTQWLQQSTFFERRHTAGRRNSISRIGPAGTENFSSTSQIKARRLDTSVPISQAFAFTRPPFQAPAE